MPTQIETWDFGATGILQPVTDPADARWSAVGGTKIGANLTIPAGTVMGKKTSDGKLYAYDDTKTDGTQTAVNVSMYSFKTDASGNILLGDVNTASYNNVPVKEAPFFYAGTFDPADLIGEDAAALVDLGGRVTFEGWYRIP